MIAIPFVFAGTEEEFRALDPAPVHYWGRWTAATVGSALVGIILTDDPNVRSHTHPKMTFLPSNGARQLSDEHIAACKNLGVGIEKGHTVHDAFAKVHAVNSADFLHPDRL